MKLGKAKARRHLFAAWILLAPAIAGAQGVAAEVPAPARADGPAPSTALALAETTDALADAQPGELESIVVNARKRSEKLQDVPLPVTSISGNLLERNGDYTIQDLSDLAPNLYIAPSNVRQTSIGIRGLGKNSANDGLETSVGVYVDGVYLAQPGEATFDLSDLDHVEVLRGPQGTLFGKNNTAGVLSFYTRKPSLTPSVNTEIIGGNDGTYEFHAAATGPLADRTAYRLTAYDKQRDGFFTNLYDGSKSGGFNRRGVRGQLLDESWGDVTLRLIAEHYESNELFANSVLVAPFTQYADGTPYTKSLVTAGAKYGYDNVIFEPWSRLLNLNSPRPVRTTQSAFSGQATWKIGANTLESITAFRRYTFDARNDGDGSPLDIIDWTGTISSNRQWSEELRLSSPAGEKLEYVAGLYYYHLSLWSNSPTAFGSLASAYYGAVNPATLGGVLQNTIGTPVTNSYAAFAQANYHLADAWTATAGLRETKESKSATITNPISGGVDPATLSAADQAVYAGQIQTGTASTSFSANALSWLASLSHPLGEDTNTYVTAARGFKSGGINIEVTNVPLVVAPETALDFEAGIKTQLWDRRLQLNANLYWSTIHNYQGNFQSANPVLGQYIANVGDVRVRGLELESGLRATESLRLRFTGAYNDAVYRNFTNATCPAELADAASICDYSGKVLPFAPHWTGTLAADYVRNLAPDLVAYAGGSEVAHSTENVNSGLSRFGVQTGYAQTNLQAGLIGRNGGYDLSLWVKNLFDAQYYTALGPTKVLGVRVIAGTPGDPRTYGVTLRLHF